MKISNHFTQKDLTCNCGCGTYIEQPKLIKMLEDLRQEIWDRVGRECYCIVHCGLRCDEHNKKYGEPTSRHTVKMYKKNQGACDFHYRGITIKHLHSIVSELWHTKKILTGGFSNYDWGVHIDTSRRRTW